MTDTEINVYTIIYFSFVLCILALVACVTFGWCMNNMHVYKKRRERAHLKLVHSKASMFPMFRSDNKQDRKHLKAISNS